MSGFAVIGLLIIVIICAILSALDASVAFLAGCSIAVIIICAIFAVIKYICITENTYGNNNMKKPIGFILVFGSSMLSDLVCAVSVISSFKWYLDQTINHGIISMVGMLLLGWIPVLLMCGGFVVFKTAAVKLVEIFEDVGTRSCIIGYLLMSIANIFVSTTIIGYMAQDSFREAFRGSLLGDMYQFLLNLNPLV